MGLHQHVVIYEGQTYPLLSALLIPLTVAANNASRIYGHANPVFGVSYSTVPIGGLSGTLNFSGTALTATNVGS